jgi:hypothetical protein
MTAEECHSRARACVSNAALATDVAVSSEFMKTAAQWRAMAERQILLGHIEAPTEPEDSILRLPS